ncbi:MAG TPA: hypothetical protein VEH76_02855 [Methylocystis sp.]|nr:hypothetical protein [Methylocystis sp.]
MISILECAESAGLSSRDLLLGVSPSPRHRQLLDSYLLNLDRGAVNVREMIVADLHAFLDLGLPERAADALVALRLFLDAFPEARSRRRRPPREPGDAGASIIALAAFRPGRRQIPGSCRSL